MANDPDDLLPVSGSALSADPQLGRVVRAFGSRHGFDYLDDGKVRGMLAEQRQAFRRTTRGGLVWVSSLAGTVGLAWLLWAGLSKPERIAVAVTPPAVLLVLAVAAFVHIYRRGKRKLKHPYLVGYRHVLAAALAHGVPVTHVPDWLVGRSDGGVEAAPLPPYTAPPGNPSRSSGQQPPHSATGFSAGLPRKPEAVVEYERIADAGGWHDELGCILILAGCAGVGYGFVKDMPAAFAAVVLVGLGVWTLTAGYRLGRRKRELGAEARRYVEHLTRAQAAGSVVPELSPQLRKLLDSSL
jgi:hypothetical protein